MKWKRFKRFLARKSPEVTIQQGMTIPARSLSWRASFTHWYPHQAIRWMKLTTRHHECGCWTRFGKRHATCGIHLREYFDGILDKMQHIQKTLEHSGGTQCTFGVDDEEN